MGPPPRLRDVALAAGVSVTTASLVLNEKAEGSIPADTRTRVRDAAEELGYRPNATARSLRTQRSMTLGMVSDEIATTPHAGPMIQAVQEVAARHGYLVLLVNTGHDELLERRSIESLTDRQIDGLLYATMYHQQVRVPDLPSSVPLVFLDARPVPEAGAPLVCSVVPDEIGGTIAAIDHLVQAGHRRIGFLNNSDPIPAASERLEGYRIALKKHGIRFDATIVVQKPDRTPTVTKEAALAILDRFDRPSAMFCYNDRMAVSVYQAARALNLDIPRDLSVVGFDNQRLIIDCLEPELTTVQLPHYEMGAWAAEELIARIADPTRPVSAHRMPSPLVAGKSVAPPGAIAR